MKYGYFLAPALLPPLLTTLLVPLFKKKRIKYFLLFFKQKMEDMLL